MIKKFCPHCNNNLIDENDSYCQDCKKELKIKENKKKLKKYENNESFSRKKWNKEYQEWNEIYQSPYWDMARNYIISKQLGMCMICFIQGEYTEGDIVHHIIPLKDNKSLAFSESNLIFVCHHCHNKIHSIYDTSKEDKAEMIQYLQLLRKKVEFDFKLK